MAHQLHPKSFPSSHHSFALKPPSQITTTTTTTLLKIITLIQAYFSRHVSHVVRALVDAKSMTIELLNTKNTTENYIIELRKKKKTKKNIFRSIRMCFRSSSHVIPMPEPRSIEEEDFNAISHEYYDSMWNSMISTNEGNDDMEPPLYGYLQWLEEKYPDGLVGDEGGSEIDRLAEKFIQRCHDKFRLEKQESYRRYQEMLARSL